MTDRDNGFKVAQKAYDNAKPDYVNDEETEKSFETTVTLGIAIAEDDFEPILEAPVTVYYTVGWNKKANIKPHLASCDVGVDPTYSYARLINEAIQRNGCLRRQIESLCKDIIEEDYQNDEGD
jgi:hypothetical protein